MSSACDSTSSNVSSVCDSTVVQYSVRVFATVLCPVCVQYVCPVLVIEPVCLGARERERERESCLRAREREKRDRERERASGYI